MTKLSLMIATVGFLSMTGGVLAADVTFAMQAPAGAQVVFSVAPLKGLPKHGATVDTTTTINGVDYYVWKTSISGIAHVCAVNSSNATAQSKCTGTMGAQLQVTGDFIELK